MKARARPMIDVSSMKSFMTLRIASTMKMVEMRAEKISSVKRVTRFINEERSKSASSVVKSAVHKPSHTRAGRNSMSSATHIR